MMRRFAQWMRVVLPPRWAVVLFMVGYVWVESLYLWVRWWPGLPEDIEAFTRLHSGYIGAGCAAYALFRIWAFHPLFRPAYRQWLERTPWTKRKPLPLGPVYLVAQDAVVLGVAFLVVHGRLDLWYLPLTAFLGVYLTCVCVYLWVAREAWVGYILAFGLGLVAWGSPNLPVAVLGLGLLYLLGWFGLQRSLDRFPLSKEPWWERSLPRQIGRGRDQNVSSALGWQFDLLGPTAPRIGVSYRDGILSSLLVGWWLYVIASRMPANHGPNPLLILSYASISVTGVVLRLMRYCGSYWPPIGLWGRLRTMRWIIPRYDQVFVAPICSALIAALAPLELRMLRLPLEIGLPISASLVTCVVLNMGPSLRQWQLTGAHRIVSLATRRPQSAREGVRTSRPASSATC